MSTHCKSNKLLQLFRLKKPKFLFPLFNNKKEAAKQTLDVESEYQKFIMKRPSNSRNSDYERNDYDPAYNTFHASNARIRSNSISKPISRVSKLRKEDTDPYYCMNTLGFRKYKVVERQHNTETAEQSEGVVQMNKSIYQSRYVIYINNHNILNNIKSFLKDHIGCIDSIDVAKLIKLVDYYEKRISEEEVQNYK